jgi:HEPN domain-containing protein
MAETFEQRLAKVARTTYPIDLSDRHQRMEKWLPGYFNKADDLRKSAEILMREGGPRNVSSMLAGMALELLLKGIARALDGPAKSTHSLTKLADDVGIAITEDERVILDIMSEHIYWIGRYTAPRKANSWDRIEELENKRRKPSGSSADMASRGSSDTSRQLWEKFATYFHKARRWRFETAESKTDQ